VASAVAAVHPVTRITFDQHAPQPDGMALHLYRYGAH
jgi:hypothetical protein